MVFKFSYCAADESKAFSLGNELKKLLPIQGSAMLGVHDIILGSGATITNLVENLLSFILESQLHL